MRLMQLLNVNIRRGTGWRRLHLLTMNGCLPLISSQTTVSFFHNGLRGTRKNIPEVYQNMAFKSVYHFPYIRLAGVVSRMKIYQTALTFIAVPSVSAMYLLGSVSQKALTMTIGIATLAGVMLYIMSYLFRRVLGIIAISDDGNVVRFSHMTFWGNRTDVYVPTENIVPLSDYCTNAKDIYIPLKTYDSSDVLYMSFVLGKILDYDSFQKIFGNFAYLKNR
ncbi:hypothetical protein LSH36_34g06021 [Paralvinella palmiformis]|uniref:Transmembrane protein 186 n=1 Tax=Paralvinella palmiformis TaxID=53620 RepID=A0AAD9K8M8_9ANNE|nr:hypothetical protein LSH36_34g06021 [Paralvinella palmiformis]